jgi:sulfite reductase alpha subunit-like flavoprotein
LERWPLPKGVEEVPAEVLLPPKWVLEFEEEPTNGGNGTTVEEGEAMNGSGGKMDAQEVMQNLHAPRPGSLLAKVQCNDRVTAPDHWQDVRKYTFELPEPMEWEPGDTLSLSPKNFPEDVDLFLSLQNCRSAVKNQAILLPESKYLSDTESSITVDVEDLVDASLGYNGDTETEFFYGCGVFNG